MFETEFSLIFWSAVSFVVLLIVLKKWALPPLLEILKNRDEMIKKALKVSEESKLESEKILEEARKKIEEEKRKFEMEVFSEKKKIEDLKSKILDEAKKTAQAIIEEANLTIERQRVQVIKEIREEIAQLIIETTKKFLRQRLTSKDQEELLKESLAEIEKIYEDRKTSV